MRFLPRDIGTGEPGLQSRLDAAHEAWFERMRAELPGSVRAVDDWPSMLRAAGLTSVRRWTSLLDLQPPLAREARHFLYAHLDRLRGTLAESLSPSDTRTLDTLLDGTDPVSILQRRDAFVLSATTVISGERPRPRA